MPLQLLGNMIRYLLAMVIGHIALSKLSRFAWYKITRCIYAMQHVHAIMHFMPHAYSATNHIANHEQSSN